MRRNQTLPSLALLLTALVLFALFGTFLIAGPISFLYNSVAGMSTATTVAQDGALIAAAVLFVAGLIVAVPTLLQPGNWARKVLYVLPIYMLALLLVGAIANAINIGTTGTLFQTGSVLITFIAAWLILGGVLSVITVVPAAALARLSARTVRLESIVVSLAAVVGIIAAAALLVTVVIVSTNQPSVSRFDGPGGGGGFPPGAQGAPGGFGQATAPNVTQEVGANAPSVTQEAGANTPSATQEAPSRQGFGGFGAAATEQAGNQAGFNGFGNQQAGTTPSATEQVGNRQAGGTQFGGQDRQRGGDDQGGPPPGGGGFGGGLTISENQYKIGGGIAAVLALLDLVVIVGVWRTSRALPAQAAGEMTIRYPRELGRAAVSILGLTIAVFLAIQLVSVSRTNPTVQTTIQWDSAQTQQLWVSTCADCHSNETRWPWYAYIAPMSWLTTLHVNDARQQYDLSDFDSLPSFRRQMLAEQMAEQIRGGTMPPADYQILHPDARLTDEERQALIDGLQKSLAATP